jgi:hypothetical protein
VLLERTVWIAALGSTARVPATRGAAGLALTIEAGLDDVALDVTGGLSVCKPKIAIPATVAAIASPPAILGSWPADRLVVTTGSAASVAERRSVLV